MRNDNKNFTDRFTEVCGTSEPAKIQRLLDISYQAAKNYLQGRTPDSNVLITIAHRTPYSIHWLLTGEGEKLVSPHRGTDTTLSAHQIRDLVREECGKVINELLLDNRGSAQQKVVVLQSADLKSEKIKESTIVSEHGHKESNT